jgi:hypothetical protein
MHWLLTTEKTTCINLPSFAYINPSQDSWPRTLFYWRNHRQKYRYLQRPNNRNVHWENTHEINNSVQRLRGVHPIRRKPQIADYRYKSVVLFFGITPFIPEHSCANHTGVWTKPTVTKVQSDSTSCDCVSQVHCLSNSTGKTDQKLSSLVNTLVS